MANGGGKVDSTLALTTHVTRPLITVMLVGTLCYGFIFGSVSVEAFVPIVATAIAFWFAQRGQDKRASDSETPPGATATAPPSGGTATASVTPTPTP